MRMSVIAMSCAATLALSGCGGTKLVRNAAPAPTPVNPVASADDGKLAAALDWVIIRNGPGAWAKNADWDEYLLRVHNASATPLQVTSVSVTDSGGYRATALADRKDLVKGSKATTKRYRDAGIKVMAGRGGTFFVASGIGATTLSVGYAMGSAIGSMGTGATASTSVGAGATALFVAGPVLVTWGIVRAVNNHKVGGRIETRATALPASVAPGGDAQLDVFVPLSPSPQAVSITYRDDSGEHVLQVDTRQALGGMHLAPAATLAKAR